MATTATKSWISKEPGRCGGRAGIRDTRNTLWGLEEWRRLGLTDEQIMLRVPDVTSADLSEAWQYVATHLDEIETDFRQNHQS